MIALAQLNYIPGITGITIQNAVRGTKHPKQSQVKILTQIYSDFASTLSLALATFIQSTTVNFPSAPGCSVYLVNFTLAGFTSLATPSGLILSTKVGSTSGLKIWYEIISQILADVNSMFSVITLGLNTSVAASAGGGAGVIGPSPYTFADRASIFTSSIAMTMAKNIITKIGSSIKNEKQAGSGIIWDFVLMELATYFNSTFANYIKTNILSNASPYVGGLAPAPPAPGVNS